MINATIQFCGINSQGKSCYSADVVNSIRAGFELCETDPSSCTCSNVQDGIDSVGCCINVVDDGGAVNITGVLQEFCNNLNIPKPCEKSSLSGAMAPTVHNMGALTGAFAVLLSLVML